MARYEHLPIYKAALDMTVHFEKLVVGFSRYHKYTLWTELRQGSRATLQQVAWGLTLRTAWAVLLASVHRWRYAETRFCGRPGTSFRCAMSARCRDRPCRGGRTCIQTASKAESVPA